VQRPDNYEKPESTNRYFRPPIGTSRIRIISKTFIQGNKAWEILDNGDKRPVRGRVREIIPGKDHKPFWALGILDRADTQIKIWEPTQVTIHKMLDELMDNPEWGDLNEFDIQIRREGDGMSTKYSITPCPKTPLTEAEQQQVKETPVNLDVLFTDGDPFAVNVNPDDTIAKSDHQGDEDNDGTTEDGDADSEDEMPF
jgi:hypothetical protein